MTNAGSPRNNLSDSDILALMCFSPFAVPIVIALVPGWLDSSLTWLVDHNILVAAAQSPIVTFPGDIGGVDQPRLVICVAALIVATVCAASSIRLLRQRRIDRRLVSGDRA